MLLLYRMCTSEIYQYTIYICVIYTAPLQCFVLHGSVLCNMVWYGMVWYGIDGSVDVATVHHRKTTVLNSFSYDSLSIPMKQLEVGTESVDNNWSSIFGGFLCQQQQGKQCNTD